MKNRREMASYDEDPRGRMGGVPQPNSIRRMPVSPEQTFFHFDFLRALEMHRGLALGIFATALLLSAAYMARRWNNYKAESLVYVQPSPPRLLESAPGVDTVLSHRSIGLAIQRDLRGGLAIVDVQMVRGIAYGNRVHSLGAEPAADDWQRASIRSERKRSFRFCSGKF